MGQQLVIGASHQQYRVRVFIHYYLFVALVYSLLLFMGCSCRELHGIQMVLEESMSHPARRVYIFTDSQYAQGVLCRFLLTTIKQSPMMNDYADEIFL
jgi:hypothetical protein